MMPKISYDINVDGIKKNDNLNKKDIKFELIAKNFKLRGENFTIYSNYEDNIVISLGMYDEEISFPPEWAHELIQGLLLYLKKLEELELMGENE